MCKIFNFNGTYFFKLNQSLTPNIIIEKLRKNSGMKKDSFAEEYVIKIFSQILYNAEDLFENYNTYYYQEYSSFSEYLYNKELLDSQLIKKINLGTNEHLWKIHMYRNGYNVKNIIGYNNENLEILNSVICGIVNEI